MTNTQLQQKKIQKKNNFRHKNFESKIFTFSSDFDTR